MRSDRFKILLGLFAFCFICKSSLADMNLFDSANAFYAKGNYEKAITQYEAIINMDQVSAELYYNLGNAYYKTNEIGLAILNYERAKKLDPSSEDLLTNLKLANQKTEDKIDKAPELFLTTWKNSMVELFSEQTWSILCIFTFLLSLVFISLFILSQHSSIKKTGFFGGAFLLTAAVITFMLAGHKYELDKDSSNAVITSATATITGSPGDKGTKLFILHEGTKVSITQDAGEWVEIKIANGNIGWIKNTLLEKI